MNKPFNFIKLTISGGLLFLIPVVVAIMVLAKAVHFLRSIVRPLAQQIPFTHVAGFGVVSILAILLLLLVCFLAGLFMRTPVAKKIKVWLEDGILSFIPGYAYLKELSMDTLAMKTNENWKPASILVDDNEVICFVVDETEHYCSLFIPDAPRPSSGSVCVRAKAEVRYLPIEMNEAKGLIRTFGKGAANILEKIRPQTS